MFGKRKPKPANDKDEDPIVPRGLIWHATAESNTQASPGPVLVPKIEPSRPPLVTASHEKTPPQQEKSKKDPFGMAVQYAQVLEMARRERRQPNERPEQPARENDSIATPIPWWRLQDSIAESPRPSTLKPQLPLIHPAATVAASVHAINSAAEPTLGSQGTIHGIQELGALKVEPKPVRTPVIPVEPAQTVALARSPGAGDDLTAGPRKKENVKSFTPAMAQLRDQVKKLHSVILSWKRRLGDKGTGVLQAVDLRNKASRSMQRARVLTASTRWHQALRSSLGAIKKASNFSLAHAPKFSDEKRSIPLDKETEKLGPTRSNMAELPPLQAQLVESPVKARIPFDRQRSSSRMRSNASYDARLWISMTMAAVAAMIALTIVSLVPHYAARSLPSRILAIKPTVRESSADTDVRRVPEKNMKSDKAGSTRKTASANTTARPKTRRTDDDDYVAPNTYKYYGNGSQSSR